MSLQSPAPGTMLSVYQIEHFLGSGSMGDVFAAFDTSLARRVALKILSERHRDNAELRARFVREGRAVAAISHPHVVGVFATGTYQERPYIAMEFLDGTDLGTLVERQGPLSPEVAAAALRDAALGLEAAAHAGIIHRDVKPSNLVRLQSGTVKVTDFGLAKPLDPTREPALTGMGVVVGTPDYIAPEQARGDALDERCDIYALGGTLYFLLTGRPPYRTGIPAEDKYLKVVARHLRDPVPDPAALRGDVDPALASLCQDMMSKLPAERPSYPQIVARAEHLLGASSRDRIPRALSERGSQRIDPTASTAQTSRPLRETSVGAATTNAGTSRALTNDLATMEQALAPWPRWLFPLTLVALAVFATGAFAFARGLGARRDAPSPPALEVRIGATRVLLDREPVTGKAFAAVFADHPLADPSAPVTSVTYTQAKAYAEAVGKRLPRREELAAAGELLPGLPSQLWEWVESPASARIIMRTAHTKPVADSARSDTTFRLAKDLDP